MNLEDLFNLNDKESLIQYIDSVIADIEKRTIHENIIGFEHTVPHKGIIDSDTIITNVDAVFSFTTNEYAYLFAEGLKRGNIHNLRRAVNCVYFFIRAYFGLERDDKNRDILFSSKGRELSINDLEGKNAAVCAERAAVAQNLFSILGIEAYYMVGQVNTEPHAYNIIKYEGNYFLYDSSKDIPKFVNGKQVDWEAYVKPISSKQLETLFNGGKISFDDGRTYSSYGKYEFEMTNKTK